MRHTTFIVFGIVGALIGFGCGGSGSATTKSTSSTPSTPTPGATPSAPTNLTAQTLSASSVSLVWTDTANNETAFVLERKNVTLNQGFVIVTSTIAANTQAYTDTGLATSTTYAWRVKAINTSGGSPYSQEATALTNAPSNTPAAPSNLTVTALSSTELKLDWTDNSTNETGFGIERYPIHGVGYWIIATVGQDVTTVTIPNLSPNTAYQFCVFAKNAFGDSPSTPWVKGRTQRTGPTKSWVRVTNPSKSLQDIWGTAPNDLWALGMGSLVNENILHYDGATWSFASLTPPLTYPNLDSIRGRNANDVWAVGSGNLIYHFDGVWRQYQLIQTQTTRTAQFTSVLAFTGNNAWAIDRSGDIYRYDGLFWTHTDSLQKDTYAIRGLAANDIWVVGGNTVNANSNTIVGTTFQVMQPVGYHYDGVQWSDQFGSQYVGEYLYDVWPIQMNDVWAVGDKGTIRHYNGAFWTSVTSPTTKPLQRLWGSSADDVWAIGNDGTILYYDGFQWSLITSPTIKDITGIWGFPPDDLWIVTEDGGIYHYQ